MTEYTRWLNHSDETRDNEVFAGLYAELRRIARSKMAGERQGGTLDTCGLLHEAWLRLEKSAPAQWRDRKQFYAAASEAMRRILVEAARRRMAAKRGGGEKAVPLDDELPVAAPMEDERLLDVHEALGRLETESPMDAQIVKLRFFSGLGNGEIATLLDVSERTVERHWKLAKLWLYRELKEPNE
ncbi:sigma-70 family RNA polymerase sigma factor [Akkermansiaceae bacterium]|nr:sigma-70 family RNA polymerase sigma factor [Akkermansiaceae bacterium]